MSAEILDLEEQRPEDHVGDFTMYMNPVTGHVTLGPSAVYGSIFDDWDNVSDRFLEMHRRCGLGMHGLLLQTYDFGREPANDNT